MYRKANCQFILHDSKIRPHTPIFRLEWVIWPLFLYERLWLSLKCTLYAWKQSKSDASISTTEYSTLLIVGRSPMENEMQSLNEGVAGCHFLMKHQQHCWIEINKIMMISNWNIENLILLKAHTLLVWTHATFYFHIKYIKLVPFLVSINCVAFL